MANNSWMEIVTLFSTEEAVCRKCDALFVTAT